MPLFENTKVTKFQLHVFDRYEILFKILQIFTGIFIIFRCQSSHNLIISNFQISKFPNCKLPFFNVKSVTIIFQFPNSKFCSYYTFPKCQFYDLLFFISSHFQIPKFQTARQIDLPTFQNVRFSYMKIIFVKDVSTQNFCIFKVFL